MAYCGSNEQYEDQPLTAPSPIRFPMLLLAVLAWALPPVLYWAATTLALRQKWYFVLPVTMVRGSKGAVMHRLMCKSILH